jgi:hypothetical protein
MKNSTRAVPVSSDGFPTVQEVCPDLSLDFIPHFCFYLKKTWQVFNDAKHRNPSGLIEDGCSDTPGAGLYGLELLMTGYWGR